MAQLKENEADLNAADQEFAFVNGEQNYELYVNHILFNYFLEPLFPNNEFFSPIKVTSNGFPRIAKIAKLESMPSRAYPRDRRYGFPITIRTLLLPGRMARTHLPDKSLPLLSIA